MRFLFLTLTILAAMTPTSVAQAAGVGVKPSRLELDGVFLGMTRAEILVTNVEESPALYEVSFDDFPAALVEPMVFRLEAGANQLVALHLPVRMAGRANYTLSVIARPLAATSLSAATGVKIPVQLTARLAAWQILTLAGVLGLSVGFMVQWKRKSRIRLV